MAETKTTTKSATSKAPLNVYEKLLKVREELLGIQMNKSGKNGAIGFHFFELTDIVPVATPLFVKYKLLPIITFSSDKVCMTIMNTENPEEFIPLQSPIVYLEGNRGMNAVQSIGATHTYMRRYMYMLALDIVENDTIDAQKGNPVAELPQETKPSKPVTTEERKEIKEKLTDTSAQANDLQIKGLKAALKTLKTLKPDSDTFIQQIVLKTDKFTNISVEQCEQLTENINGMIAELKGE